MGFMGLVVADTGTAGLHTGGVLLAPADWQAVTARSTVAVDPPLYPSWTSVIWALDAQGALSFSRCAYHSWSLHPCGLGESR